MLRTKENVCSAVESVAAEKADGISRKERELTILLKMDVSNITDFLDKAVDVEDQIQFTVKGKGGTFRVRALGNTDFFFTTKEYIGNDVIENTRTITEAEFTRFKNIIQKGWYKKRVSLATSEQCTFDVDIFYTQDFGEVLPWVKVDVEAVADAVELPSMTTVMEQLQNVFPIGFIEVLNKPYNQRTDAEKDYYRKVYEGLEC